MIKIDGYTILFNKYKNKDIDYFIISDGMEITDQMYEMFEDFFYSKHLEPKQLNDWEEWDNSKNAIAYRGGHGYYYSLFSYDHIFNK